MESEPMTKRRCMKCDRVLPVSEFNLGPEWSDEVSDGGPTRLPYSLCKVCQLWEERRHQKVELEITRRERGPKVARFTKELARILAAEEAYGAEVDA